MGWGGLCWVGLHFVLGFFFCSFFPHWKIMKEGGGKENVLPNNFPSDIDYKLKEFQLGV